MPDTEVSAEVSEARGYDLDDMFLGRLRNDVFLSATSTRWDDDVYVSPHTKSGFRMT